VIEEINYDKVSQCGNKMPMDSVTGLHNVSGTVCTEGKAHNVILQYFYVCQLYITLSLTTCS
jgi:hypothetical protein